MTSKSLVIMVILLVSALFSVRVFAAFVPHEGDYFNYYEVQNLGSGTGDYSGYSEQTIVNGMESIDGVAVDGTVSAHYAYSYDFSNSSGSTETGSSSGNFTFSSDNFLYINGTDDQTGYVNPTVWFCMDNSVPEGGTFTLLNTSMTVKSANYSYFLLSQNRSVYAIFAEGKSSYERNDVYGQFSATYTWDAYFDPSSGYIIGYVYTEQDTSPSAGFTYTENLYISSTSYSLITAPTSSGGNSGLLLDALYAAVIIIIVIVILIVIYAVSRRRRLPRHPPQQPVYTPSTEPPPSPSAPEDINLTPKQPPVQQIVIREVVKVNCRYCGALIDSTAEKCPYCGAPRS